MLFLYLYLFGFAVMLSSSLYRALRDLRLGRLDVEWHSKRGLRQVSIFMFHTMLANAAVWPFTLALQAAGYTPFVRIREPKHLDFPDDLNDQVATVTRSLIPFLNNTYGGVHAMAVAFPLLHAAWEQVWKLARHQGLSNDDARAHMVAMASCTASHPPRQNTKD